MAYVETVTHTFDDETYEIRVSKTVDGFKVETFKNGKLASPYSYNISTNTSHDIEALTTKRGYKHLIDVAISDIEEGFVFAGNKK